MTEKIRLYPLNVLFYDQGINIVKRVYDILNPVSPEMELLVDDATGKLGNAPISSPDNASKDTLDELAMRADFPAVSLKLSEFPTEKRYFLVTSPYERFGSKIPQNQVELKAVHDDFVLRRALDSIVKGDLVIHDAFKQEFGEEMIEAFLKNLALKNQIVERCYKENFAGYNSFVKKYGSFLDIDMFVFNVYEDNQSIGEIIKNAGSDLPLIKKSRWLGCINENHPLADRIRKKSMGKESQAGFIFYNPENFEEKAAEAARKIVHDTMHYKKKRKNRETTIIRKKGINRSMGFDSEK